MKRLSETVVHNPIFSKIFEIFEKIILVNNKKFLKLTASALPLILDWGNIGGRVSIRERAGLHGEERNPLLVLLEVEMLRLVEVEVALAELARGEVGELVDSEGGLRGLGGQLLDFTEPFFKRLEPHRFLRKRWVFREKKIVVSIKGSKDKPSSEDS